MKLTDRFRTSIHTSNLLPVTNYTVYRHEDDVMIEMFRISGNRYYVQRLCLTIDSAMEFVRELRAAVEPPGMMEMLRRSTDRK